MHSDFVKLFAQKTLNNPAFIHLDLIGLIRLGKTNAERLKSFCNLLTEIENSGGNVCIPAFTLSYTKNQIFDVLNSPSSDVGVTAEFIRSSFPGKRTYDGLFSYVAFGKNFSGENFIAKDFETFGDNSIIGEVFNKDGYLCGIGGVFRNSTEIHYIEKLLEVDYRHDKIFEGKLIDADGVKHNQRIKYFCKNFDFNLWYDFSQLESDLKKEGLIEIFKTEDLHMYAEMIKFKVVYDFIKEKIKKEKNYLIKNLKDKRKE